MPHHRLFLAAAAFLTAVCAAFPAPAERLLPESDGLRPLTIIGQDNRLPVEDAKAVPYADIAFMDVVCSCGCGWECTGTLVGPDIILTSAHSLVCQEHSSPAESVITYFGFNNYYDNLYRFGGTWTAYVGNMFEEKQYSFNADWGLVQLDDRLGDRIGFLQLNPEALNTNPEGPFIIAGFSDKVLYTDSGPLVTMDDEHFRYTMDQDAGASGGPILDPEGRVAGIIIGHMEDDDGARSNVGLTLTPDLLEVYDALSRHTEVPGRFVKLTPPVDEE